MGDKDNKFKVPSTWNMIKKVNKDKVDRIMNPGEPELKEWHPELEPKYIEKPSVIDKGKALFQGAIESKRSEKEYEDVLKEMLASPDEETKMAAINAMERSKANQVRDFITDVGVDALAGAALGAALGGGTGAATGQKAGKNEIANLTEKSKEIIAKEGKQGLQKANIGDIPMLNKATAIESNHQINKLMQENKDTAIKFGQGIISGEKAMKNIYNNFKKEAEIGPDYLPDIYYTLAYDTNKSKKEIESAVNSYIKNHKYDTKLIDLLKLKEPKQIYNHIIRTADVEYKLAREFGLPIEEAKKMKEFMLLHDMGKITVPDNLLNSSINLRDHPEKMAKMNEHMPEGYDILKNISNYYHSLALKAAENGNYGQYNEFNRKSNLYEFYAYFAGTHHNNDLAKNTNQIDDFQRMINIAADQYEAMTSKDRTYKDGFSFEKTKDIMSGNEFFEGYNLPEKLDSMKKRRQIPRWKNNDDEIVQAYQAIRANALKKKIIKEYRDAYAKKQANKGSLLGAGLGAGVGIGNEIAKNFKQNASGGIEPTFPAYTSDVLNEAWPWWRDKKDKADNIVKWIKDGLLSEEQMELFKNTDFNNNKEVTALWKRLSKELF